VIVGGNKVRNIWVAALLVFWVLGMGLGGTELLMIDIYPWANESFEHRKYIEIELMTHLFQPVNGSGLRASY
jgi:hypothetical protein